MTNNIVYNIIFKYKSLDESSRESRVDNRYLLLISTRLVDINF